jgi:uncharacterized Fe-S cluster-containing radical SAM superfamily protein
MDYCPVCNEKTIRKSGKINVEKMTKDGEKILKYQAYRCLNNHFFSHNTSPTRFTNSFIEYVVIVYLRSLSINTTIDLVRIYFEKDILTKETVLSFIEVVADHLPTLDDIDHLYHPKRSGYVALDGVWFKYRGKNFVLLVAFDPETLDPIAVKLETDETQAGYERLITEVTNKLRAVNIKGTYGDGDKGLIKALNRLLPPVPFQTCIVHKEMKMGQIVPVKSVRVSRKLTPYQKHDIKVFQLLFRDVIRAKTKDNSAENLERLKQYAESSKDERFQRAYRSLAYNFKYTLTHFDHPEMEKDNNILEGFNSILKRKLKLLKGFKRPGNIEKYIKLILLDYRFHQLIESENKGRNGKTPLELAGVSLPKYFNFIKFLRQQLNLNFE